MNKLIHAFKQDKKAVQTIHIDIKFKNFLTKHIIVVIVIRLFYESWLKM